MTYPSPDHDINEYDRLHYPSSPIGGVGIGRRTEGQKARKDINQWLNSMTPEQWNKHLENEAAYQKSINQNKHY